MGFGAIYSESWWGNANETNGFGYVYPSTAGGSYFTADSTEHKADSTLFTADATEL